MPNYDFVEVDPITALVRRATCSHNELGPVITREFTAIMEANPDAELVGAPMAVYLEWREHDCDVEMAMPVDPNSVPGAGTELKTYPSCSAVHATHTGPYEGLYGAWMNLWAELQSNNVVVGGAPPWDAYTVGAEDDPNPDTWITDLYIPLLKL